MAALHLGEAAGQHRPNIGLAARTRDLNPEVLVRAVIVDLPGRAKGVAVVLQLDVDATVLRVRLTADQGRSEQDSKRQEAGHPHLAIPFPYASRLFTLPAPEIETSTIAESSWDRRTLSQTAN